MYALRQISASCVEGGKTELSAAEKTVYQLADIHPRYILNIGNGKAISDYISIAATGGSFSLPLPNGYDASKRLFVLIRSTKTIKCAVVSPDHPASTTLIRAGNNQDGIYSVVETITSITLTNPQSSVAKVEYFLFEYPDITNNTGWRSGEQSTGLMS